MNLAYRIGHDELASGWGLPSTWFKILLLEIVMSTGIFYGISLANTNFLLNTLVAGSCGKIFIGAIIWEGRRIRKTSETTNQS